MKDFWYTRVLEENTQAMPKVDQVTVKALELTAPGACRADARVLYGLLMNGQIFSAFSQQEREAMWPIICSWSTHRLIPSFFGFFQDVNYLEGPADCVKRLISVSHGATILSALEDSFSDVNQTANQCVIQESESTFALRPGSLKDRFELGHLQLFMFGMRDYPEMPREPGKKNLLAKSRSRADTKVLREFAAFAYRVGFESDKIHRLMHLESPTLASKEQTASLDADDSPPRRCGIPLQQHHEQDKSSLFLSKLYEGHEEACEEMTSFFVRRSVIFTFFGKPTRTGPSGGINHHQPSSSTATQSTEPFMAPAGPGDPTPMLQQRQSPRLSTDAWRGFQTAATPQFDGPSSDIPRQDEVIGSLREELTTCRREVETLQAQKTTLEGAISGKDKELGNLRDRQRFSSKDLENAREELQKQSTALKSSERANGELERSLSEAQSEANTLRSERDRLSADLTTAKSRLKALSDVQEAVSTTRSETEALRAEKNKLGVDKMVVETQLKESLSNAQSTIEELRAEKCKLEEGKATVEAQLKESLLKAQSETEKSRAEECKLEKDKTTMEGKLKESLSRAESETKELLAEKAKLEGDKATIESELKGSLITAQSEIAHLRVEKNKLEGNKAVLSDLQAQITGLEAEKMELKSCRDDAQQAFTAKSEDLQREITKLEAERMEATTNFEDVERDKRNLQSRMDTMVASLSHEIESLRRSRDTEYDQRLGAEERCQTLQMNLDLENKGKLEAIEKLTRSQRETKSLQEKRNRMAARIETLEEEIKIYRAQVAAPTAPPTVEQPTPMAPEVQSATEAPMDDAFISVLNEPLGAQNPLDNIFRQIPNSRGRGRILPPAKRRSMLPPLLQRTLSTSDPRTRVAKHVRQPGMMNRVERLEKPGRIAASRMNKMQAFSNLGPQAEEIFFNQVLFKIVENGRVSSTPPAIPFERTQVENSAKGYWPEMHLLSSTGQGVLPRICFDTLVQDGTQTIFLIPKGHQVDVNQELINAGIRKDARIDEGGQVVEIESEDEEL
jgi:hypothetical protein